MAAATEESTPPDMATSTRSVTRSSLRDCRGGAARLVDELAEYVGDAIDALVVVQAAEADAESRVRQVTLDADGRQDVRRTHRAALAGRTRRAADAAQVERHEHRLAVEARHRDVADVRRALRRMASVNHRVGD